MTIEKQITATYARNNFKEVNNKAIKEGTCIIIRKSKPITILLSIKEYEKLKREGEEFKIKKTKNLKNFTRKDFKNSTFSKYAGSINGDYKEKESLKLAKNWTNYVD